MATKRSSVRPAAELAPANVAMPPRRHLLQWEKRLVAMEEVVEAEELVPLVRATPRSVQTHAAHEEPGAPGAVASMSRTSAYAPGVAHLPSVLANY